MKQSLCIVVSVFALACGQDGSKADPNNETPNNETPNNETPNNETPNNETPNNETPNNETPNNEPINVAPGDVTYHNSVRAILEANCAGCHYEGGIGPFPLTSYEEASPLAALVASTVESGKMPPWPPADDCGEPLKHARSLEPSELAALGAWADNGAPEGDPNDYVAPEANDEVVLGSPDLTIDIGVDYQPDPPGGGIDDYHCFAIDPGFTETVYLNAYEARPSNLEVAHHMLFWAVPAGSAAEIQQLSDAEPDSPGWTCFGGNGLGNPLDNNNLLGAWVPGAQPTQFDPNVGFEIPAGSIIVVQMHYNTLNDDGTDRTSIDLHFTDGPATTVLQNFMFGDFSLNIAAGDATALEGATMTLGSYPPIYGIFPHMHTLGTRITIKADDQCVMDIPNWDFNWQGYYFYEEPITIPGGATIDLECEYDNSEGSQTVRFGEGTLDEMCLAFFVIPKL